jgi:hypothetical protein
MGRDDFVDVVVWLHASVVVAVVMIGGGVINMLLLGVVVMVVVRRTCIEQSAQYVKTRRLGHYNI